MFPPKKNWEMLWLMLHILQKKEKKILIQKNYKIFKLKHVNFND